MAARFVRQVRRGVTGTTVAAAVMATVTAAQAPSPAPKAAAPLTATGGTSFYTEEPPLTLPGKDGFHARVVATKASVGTTDFADIPATVLAAYQAAEAALAKSDPGCHLPWRLLAAIGRVESVHARGGRVDSHGTARPPILGPQLNGNGFAVISDTDRGAYDGDVRYDRAVGPMQFIPSTWSRWGSDGNNDGSANPNNVFDAALAAGRYLCAGGRDLANPQSVDQAILSYNYSTRYLATVKSWFEYYKTGYHVIPDGSGPLPPPPDSGGSPPSASAPLPTGGTGTPGAPLPGTTSPVPAPGPSEATAPSPTPSPSDPPTADPSPSDPPADPSPSDPPPSDPPPPSEPPPPSDPPPSDPPPSDPPPSDPPPSESPPSDPPSDPSPAPAGGDPASTPTPSANSSAAS